MRKNYVLDTNILIHDPHSVFQFEDNAVIIPIEVISEIDRFKKEMSDRGFNARAVVRLLDGLRTQNTLSSGIQLENGGTLRVHCSPDRVLAEANGNTDIRILRVAQEIRAAEPERPVIIVTKDINLRVRADAVGLRAEDYETDQVRLSDLYTGHVDQKVTPAEMATFRQEGRLAIPGADAPFNLYVMLADEGNPKSTALARIDGTTREFVALDSPPDGIWSIRPRNREQYFAVDALLRDEIRLVTIMGKAGTGKTLLAMAAALQKCAKEHSFRGMLVCRPTFPVGRDLGFLPGDIEQKLDPWLRPIVDTLEYLLDIGGLVRGYTDTSTLIRSPLVEVQPLTYIRGRSIANRYVVIDEAQNLTPLEVKTIITRIGQDAKVVLTGDPYQIDNPYVDGNSNGFSYLINRFRSERVAAHVELRKGERSELAELAANLL